MTEADLKHAFQLASLRPEELKQMHKYGVVNFDDMCKNKSDLKEGKHRNVSRMRQQSLHSIVLWSEAFRRVHNREADICDELTEDSLADFCANDHRIPCAATAGLKHVIFELGICNSTLITLATQGIRTFAELASALEKLKEAQLSGIAKVRQVELGMVVDWAEDFNQKHNREHNLCRDFTSKSFDIFVRQNKARYDFPVDALYTLAKECIHKEGKKDFVRTLKESDRPHIFKQIYQRGAEEAEEVHMTEALLRLSPSWRRPFTESWVRALINLPSGDQYGKDSVVFGKTQSGKTAVTALGLAVCRALRVPAIVITKGVSESRELATKLKNLAKADDRDLILLSPRKNQGADIKRIFDRGGAIVIADTACQLGKIIEAIQPWLPKKFVAIVDEADAMYRTVDRTQKLETKYDELMELGPCLRMMITATPVPVLLVLAQEEDKEVETWIIEPCDDYAGVENMRPLTDDQGKPIFLDQGCLKHNNGVKVEGGCIPFTDENVMRLYRDAAQSDAKGVLLLDVTNPRVSVEGNVKTKAECVQEAMLLIEERIVVVIKVGSGVSYRLPGNSQEWVYRGKETLVNEILDEIDDLQEECEIPVFVFGYSLMRRGISYRSSKRVPSHLVLQMGRGYSIESVVQTIGRGTFIGREILKRNGFEHVTLLTTSGDWEMVRDYPHYVEEVLRRISEDNEPIREAMHGAVHKIPAFANYLQYTSRKTGQRPKSNGFDKIHTPNFEAAVSLSEGQKQKVERYATSHPSARRKLVRVCCEMWKKSPHAFEVPDVLAAFNDTYEGTCEIKLTKVGALLREMVKDHILQDHPLNGSKNSQYSPKTPGLLKSFQEAITAVRKRKRRETAGVI